MKKLQMAFLCSIMVLLFSCKKEMTMQEQDSKVKVDYLPGPCPYDCHDTRCQGYLNGYCGPGQIPPDQSLTKDQFIAVLGKYHNDIESYIFNGKIYYTTDPATFANNICNGVSNYFQNSLSGMTITPSQKSYAISYFTNLLNNYNYYGAPNGLAMNSIIVDQINRIVPTRTSAEASLLNSAKNIYNFDPTNMSSDLMYNTIISRANSVLAQYKTISWASNNGDCIGGYLQIVINSAQFWKYFDTYGIPPVPAGGATSSVSSLSSQNPPAPMLLPIVKWFLALAAPEADAAGYLIGWGHSYFIAEENDPKKRIKEGLYTAASISAGKF